MNSRDRAGRHLADATAVEPQYPMFVAPPAGETTLVVRCPEIPENANLGAVTRRFAPTDCLNQNHSLHQSIQNGDQVRRRLARHYTTEYMSVADQHCQAHFRSLGVRNTGIQTGASLVTTGASLTATLLQNANSASLAAGIATVASTFATRGGGAIDALNASYAEASLQNVQLRQQPLRSQMLETLEVETEASASQSSAGDNPKQEAANLAGAGAESAPTVDDMDELIETVGLAADLRAYRRLCHVPVAGSATLSRPLFTPSDSDGSR
jgi:hypothetical protein